MGVDTMAAMSAAVDTEFHVVYANRIHTPWWVMAIFIAALIVVVLFLVFVLTRKRR